jgi:hypothetical protein
MALAHSYPRRIAVVHGAQIPQQVGAAPGVHDVIKVAVGAEAVPDQDAVERGPDTAASFSPYCTRPLAQGRACRPRW